MYNWHPGLKKLVEVGNSGVFRPEMLKPMVRSTMPHAIAYVSLCEVVRHRHMHRGFYDGGFGLVRGCPMMSAALRGAFRSNAQP